MKIRFGQRFWLIGITCLLLVLAAWPALAAGRGSVQIATAQALLTVQGKDVLVEVLVGFLPGEDGPGKARGALRRMYPHAIEVDSEAYTFNGLVWDIFFDSDAGNDRVSVSYNFNNAPQYDEMTFSEDRVEDALDTWTNVQSSRFVFWYEGPTNRCPSLLVECPGPQRFDGKNDVGWVSIRENGVLGVIWYGISIDEFDIALDNGSEWNWYFDADPTLIAPHEIDAETVWLHEFGHGLGLGHSPVNEAVMNAYYSEPRRDLHDDDDDGITFLYPVSSSCTSDEECDDGHFCNGNETCEDGSCQGGIDPCPGEVCDEGIDQCVDCGGNKAPCTDGSDCCSNFCKKGTCRGN